MKNTHLSSSPKHRRSLGFTLVELLVVMFIIATLASIGYGIFFKLRDTAKAKETTVFLKSIKSNMEAVKAETGIPYPTDKGELFDYLTGKGSQYEVKPAMANLLPGNSGAKFVKGTALVDSWRREIEYVYPGVKNNFEDGFDLKSDGVDPDETDDDIEM